MTIHFKFIYKLYIGTYITILVFYLFISSLLEEWRKNNVSTSSLNPSIMYFTISHCIFIKIYIAQSKLDSVIKYRYIELVNKISFVFEFLGNEDTGFNR